MPNEVLPLDEVRIQGRVGPAGTTMKREQRIAELLTESEHAASLGDTRRAEKLLAAARRLQARRPGSISPWWGLLPLVILVALLAANPEINRGVRNWLRHVTAPPSQAEHNLPADPKIEAAAVKAVQLILVAAPPGTRIDYNADPPSVMLNVKVDLEGAAPGPATRHRARRLGEGALKILAGFLPQNYPAHVYVMDYAGNLLADVRS